MTPKQTDDSKEAAEYGVTKNPTMTRPTERTKLLFSMLNSPLTEENSQYIMREVARLLVVWDREISSLPVIREHLSNISASMVNFQSDMLTSKADRESFEAEVAELQFKRSKISAQHTSQKIEAIKMGANAQPLPVGQPPQHWFTVMLKEKVLPSIITWATILLVGWIGFALWQAFKSALGQP